MTVAALFVEADGIYSRMPGVDPWPVERDARTYRGPHPVVAHPPCERWGRYAEAGPNHSGKLLGDDAGCFAAALWSVRTFGGVLEHPAHSRAFDFYGLPKPGDERDTFGGVTVQVDQGRYGHPSIKRTWLYIVGAPHDGIDTDPDTRRPARADARMKARGIEPDPDGYVPVQWLSRRQRAHTPHAFATLLTGLARGALVTPTAGAVGKEHAR